MVHFSSIPKYVVWFSSIRLCFDITDIPCLFTGVRDAIGVEIQRLSKQWNTNNIFIPHVTLVGGIECDLMTAKEFTEKLVETRALRPVDIILGNTGYGEIFHQTVFIHVSKTDALSQQHETALHAFGMDGSSNSYMPHMSLIYSEMGQVDRCAVAEEEQQRVSEILQEAYFTLQGVQNLELWYTPAADRSLQSWKCIQSYTLS